MTVEKRLILKIEASGMRDGAREAAQALGEVKRSAESATDAIERRFNEGVQRIEESFKRFDDQLGMVEASTGEYTRKTEQAAAGSEKFSKSLLSLEGVGARVEQRLLSVGKAAAGFFTVDVASRALGLGSALEAAGDASKALGDALNRIVLPGFAESQERAKKLADEMERVAALASDAQYTFQLPTGNRNATVPFNFRAIAEGGDAQTYNRVLTEFAEREKRISDLIRKRDNAQLDDARSGVVGASDDFVAELERRIAAELELQRKSLDAERARIGLSQNYYDIHKRGIEQLDAARKKSDEEWLARLQRGQQLAAEEARLNRLAGTLAPFAALTGSMGAFAARESDRLAADQARRDRIASGTQALSEQRAAEERARRAQMDALFAPDATEAITIDPARARFDATIRRSDDRRRANEQLRRQFEGIGTNLAQDLGSSIQHALLMNDWSNIGQTLAVQVESALIQAMVTQPLTNALGPIFAGMFGGLSGVGAPPNNFVGPPLPLKTDALGGTLYGPHVAYPLGGGRPVMLGEAGPEDVVRSTQRGRRGGASPAIYNINVSGGAGSAKSVKQALQDFERARLRR